MINQHIKWSVESGINAWIIGGMFDETNFLFLDSEYSDLIDYACLEGIAPKDTEVGKDYLEDSTEWFADRFRYMEKVHFPRENYLHFDDRPVLYIWAAAHRTDRLISGVREARKQLSEDIYLIADLDFWRNPARPGPRNGIREVTKAFDAITMYNLYQPFILQRRPELLNKRKFLDVVSHRLRNWAVAAAEFDADFIPSVFPGFNATLAGERARDWPIFERSPTFFRKLCEKAVKFVDPSLDAVFVTTFNEWPEYTAIEPTTEYGTTYLDIVKAELAVNSFPNSFEPEEFHSLVFEYNETVPPSELSEQYDDDRELAFAIDRMDFRSADGSSIVRYDVGKRGAEPVFVQGAWGRSSINGETFRWTGGERRRTIINVAADTSSASETVVRGMPQANERIQAKVAFAGSKVDTVEFGRRQFDEYTIDLQP